MNIYTEMTPNPASIKFILDQIIVNGDVVDFPTSESANEKSLLAENLFTLPFTKGVFLGRNFVTVTKGDDFDWKDIIPVIKQEIQTFIETGAPVVNETTHTEPKVGNSEIERNIIQIIEEQVRPAVAMDGGDIIYEGFEEGIVKLRLRGSCSGCPSSMVTLKAGIESLLLRLFPSDVKSVEAI